jgi:hypothetical protein
MFKKLMEKVKEKHLLTLELSEVKEIADLIFKRLEEKINVLEAMEASIDKKTERLEKLIQRVETIKAPAVGIERQHEIIALEQRGMKICEIADILDMPAGEVELIFNFHTITDQSNKTGCI